MDYKDFTERQYATLLDKASAQYTFAHYDDHCEGPKVVWRHDVDYSPYRALAMAKLEAKRGLHCVYHLFPSGNYYNVLTAEISDIFKKISRMGHTMGLHVDMDIFNSISNPSQAQVLERIQKEKDLLEYLLEAPIRSVSFHNTLLHTTQLLTTDSLAGMVNVCCSDIWDGYKYISDSNGYWKKETLESVLEHEPYDRLHVLTHPIWWTPTPLSPAERFQQMIDRRSAADQDIYFDTMKRDGRFADVVKNSEFNLPTHEEGS